MILHADVDVHFLESPLPALEAARARSCWEAPPMDAGMTRPYKRRLLKRQKELLTIANQHRQIPNPEKDHNQFHSYRHVQHH